MIFYIFPCESPGGVQFALYWDKVLKASDTFRSVCHLLHFSLLIKLQNGVDRS